MGEGTLGLIMAVDKYDKEINKRFETFAEYKVRGAILDSLRENDVVSRHVRISINQVEGVQNSLYAKSGRKPDKEQILEELADDKYKRQGKVGGGRKKAERIYNDAFIFSGHCSSEAVIRHLDKKLSERGLGELCDERDRALFDTEREKVQFFIDKMSSRDKTVVSLYYGKELNMKEIGKVINLTETRVSQLHSKIRKKLKGEVVRRGLTNEDGKDFVSNVLRYVVSGSADK